MLKLLGVVFLVFCHLTAFPQFKEKSLIAANREYIGFNEFLPPDYRKSGEKHPLIIFLHGISERGDGKKDLSNATKAGLPKFIKRGMNMRFYHNGKWESFVVLVPQLNSKYGYWRNFYTEEMIKYAKSKLNVDPNRIYLTGMSLGGGGVWEFASGSVENAKSLAAIVTVCGTCRLSSARNISQANLPVWAFHAKDDNTVSVNCTHNAISNILSNSPAVKPLMTIWNNGKHSIWDRVYDPNSTYIKPNIYQWMLGHQRNAPSHSEKINSKPVANAGKDQEITLPDNSVILNGGESVDKDGKIESYRWVKRSGPEGEKISNPNNSKTEVTNLKEGTYIFRLTVTDNDKATDYDEVEITVIKKPNSKPVANAGEDREITLPDNTVTLNGSESADRDGKIESYRWVKRSGPEGEKISNPNNSKTEVTNLKEGTYIFRLTVTDNDKATDYDEVEITVIKKPNSKPVANAGEDREITLPDNSVTLDGSESSDRDGKIESYRWVKRSGPEGEKISNPNNRTTEITNLNEGTYVFRLTVTDNDKATDYDEVKVAVHKQVAVNIKPVANAGKDQEITLPDNTVTLDGSESADRDGKIESYRWVKRSGPEGEKISNPNNRSTEITNLKEGTYIFRLTVTDNDKAKDYDEVRVTVHKQVAVNIKPVANAGKDQEITLPDNTVTLDGSESSDRDGKIESYRWVKRSGPEGEKISNPNNRTTEITNLKEGTYVFRLTVTDNDKATDYDEVKVTVHKQVAVNIKPVANAGKDQEITLPDNTVTLDGSESSDRDGKIESYRWVKRSGPEGEKISNPNNRSTEITNLKEGTYIFRLTVTDNDKATDYDEVKVAVHKQVVVNIKPVANAGKDQEITLPDNSVTLDGSESSDRDGKIESYRWVKRSGPEGEKISNPNNRSTEITNLNEGTYIFRLTVTDNDKATDYDEVKVTVHKQVVVNIKPVANAGKDQEITLPDNSVTLDGSESSDRDGKIESYRWVKRSGPEGEKISNPNNRLTEITNLKEGTYIFRLTVTDNDKATDYDEVKVTVHKQVAVNIKPVANAGKDQEITLPDNTVTLDGSESADRDGKIESYRWVKRSGPEGEKISNPNNRTTEITNLKEGTYIFRLTVTDNDKATDYDEVKVTVHREKENTPPVAVIKGSSTVILPDNKIALSGEASTDRDGTIEKYLWTLISGGDGAQITHPNNSTTDITGLKEGNYLIQLAVWDNKGEKATATHKIIVQPAPRDNKPPIADAGKNIEVYMPVKAIVLNGTASRDTDGKIIQFYWKMINGPATYKITNEASAKAIVTDLQPGKYIFRLYVTDNDNVISHDDMLLTVNPKNEIPVSIAGESMKVRKPGEIIILDGSKSYDNDGKIVRYFWSKLAGPANFKHTSYEEKTVTLSEMAPGIYLFRLRVFDNMGASSVSDVRISVQTAGSALQTGSGAASSDSLLAQNSSEENFAIELKVYPNPAHDRININIQQENNKPGTINIYNSAGTIVKTIQQTEQGRQVSETIDISKLSAGVYYIEYRTEKFRKTKNFIKQ